MRLTQLGDPAGLAERFPNNFDVFHVFSNKTAHEVESEGVVDTGVLGPVLAMTWFAAAGVIRP
jgi:hypothetical protein